MRVTADISALKRTRWHDYAIRFLFGGIITAMAGIIAKEFGPSVGGLFLAFPAIFPASATLIEKHEKQKKRRAGLDGSRRGRQAASLDAAGAAIGSIGLRFECNIILVPLAFGAFVYAFLPHEKTWEILACSTLIWLAVSGFIWRLRKAI